MGLFFSQSPQTHSSITLEGNFVVISMVYVECDSGISNARPSARVTKLSSNEIVSFNWVLFVVSVAFQAVRAISYVRRCCY